MRAIDEEVSTAMMLRVEGGGDTVVYMYPSARGRARRREGKTSRVNSPSTVTE
jgi:hypothetical protein